MKTARNWTVVKSACLLGVALCLVGCGDSSSPSQPSTVQDAGADACNPAVEPCGMKCSSDSDCPAGSLCDSAQKECVPGCNAAHGCAAGRDCCAGECVDLKADSEHCGACSTACAPTAPHTKASCVARKCTLGACDKGWGDCNVKSEDGCEKELSGDPDNCGACKAVCSVANIDFAVCESGACTGACAKGWGDCDGDKLKNGCETSLTNDVANCGGCDAACSDQHVASKVCTMGECTGPCAPGFGDCNGDKQKDGCETAFGDDPLNCGACNVVCSSNHINAPKCSGGVCQAACNQGWADCNGNPLTDGCEIDTANDSSNCGTCGAQCSSNHMGSVSCTSGACTGYCQSGYSDCDGDLQANGCETTTVNDVANCGKCGTVCSSNHTNPSCNSGTCTSTCLPGWADCDGDLQGNGCETEIYNDPGHCGSCGTVCSSNHTTPACSYGTCVSACAGGWSDCNYDKQYDGCETEIFSNVSHCGGCGSLCSSNNLSPSCSYGVCTGACNQGYSDCNGNLKSDGCETDILSSAYNCGGCGVGCSANHISAICSGGVCSGTCLAGYADCNSNKQGDGCETYIYSTTSCGACGVACSSNHITASCPSGICAGACQTGWADCNTDKQADGCEADIYTDVNRCGGCNNVCSTNHVAASCSGGVCNGPCEAGWADCNFSKLADGCEVDTSANVLNCGGCAKACSANHVPAPTCDAGVCTGACATGWTDCNNNKQTDGCEADLQASVLNCGACGLVCSTNHITATCAAGACTGACSTGWTDCNNNKQSDGCEINTAADASNCGTCGTVCGSGEKCINGACKTCNSNVLVLADASTTSNQALVDALNAAGLAASSVTNGQSTYAGSPAATTYGAIIIPVGGNYNVDMPAAGQTAIVNANAAGTGVVFTEWASYVGATTSTKWTTLKQLVLFNYSSTPTLTKPLYTLTSSGHAIWTGLPASFTFVNNEYASLGTLKNGGVSIASSNPGTYGVVVKDATGRVVNLNHTAHYNLTGGYPWTNDTNVTKLMVNAAKWAARCL